MNGLPRLTDASQRGSRTRSLRSASPKIGECRRHAEHRSRTPGAVLESKQHTKAGVADAHCVLQHRLEYWLQLARRTRNDAQHLRGRGLLLQCLGKFERPLVELLSEIVVGSAATARNRPLRARRRFHGCAAKAIGVMSVSPLIKPSQTTGRANDITPRPHEGREFSCSTSSPACYRLKKRGPRPGSWNAISLIGKREPDTCILSRSVARWQHEHAFLGKKCTMCTKGGLGSSSRSRP